MYTDKEQLQNSLDPSEYGIQNYSQQYVDELFTTLLFEDKKQRNSRFTQAMREATSDQKKMVQFALVAAGYDISYRGMSAKDGVDGDPGNKTHKAVLQYLTDQLETRDDTDTALDRVHQRQTLIAHTAEQLGNETQAELYLDHKKTKRKEQFSTYAYETHLEPRIESIYNQYKAWHAFTANYKKPFNHISINDIQALTYYESKFIPEAKSTTGSTGLMQITEVAIKDFIADPAKYDLPTIKKELSPFGYSLTGICKSTETRREALRNPHVNTILGLAYLNTCEQRSIHPTMLSTIKAHKADLIQGAASKLQSQGVLHCNTATLTALYTDVLHDKATQSKFGAYVRYNGEEDTSYGKIQDKYIYALCVLYMGTYCF